MWRKQLPIFLLVFLCTPFEASVATCGDGLREENEQCEDGNQVRHLFRLRLAMHATLCASDFRIGQERVQHHVSMCTAEAGMSAASCLVIGFFVDQVSGDGCSSECTCESDPCEFRVSSSVRLSSVVARLGPGATITLAPGTYGCGWSLSSTNGDARAIIIRGSGPSSTIVDCGHTGPVVEGIVVATQVRFEGIRFTNAFRSGSGGSVVRAESGSHVHFENCEVHASSSDQEVGHTHIHTYIHTYMRITHIRITCMHTSGRRSSGQEQSAGHSCVTLQGKQRRVKGWCALHC